MEDKVYYAVFYSKDGTIHLWPGKSMEDCEKKLIETLRVKKCYDKCRRTTIMSREAKAVGKDGYVFGSPESRNMLSKFDKMLECKQIDFFVSGKDTKK